jgi:hypothetical protein
VAAVYLFTCEHMKKKWYEREKECWNKNIWDEREYSHCIFSLTLSKIHIQLTPPVEDVSIMF